MRASGIAALVALSAFSLGAQVQFAERRHREPPPMASMMATTTPHFVALYGKQHLPTTLGASTQIVVRDVNGDGAPDLVNSPQYSTARLHLNDGQGRFVDVSLTRLPASPNQVGGVAVGDIDGDGDLDIVYGATADAVYSNDGFGIFAPSPLPQPVGLHSHPYLADVDGDGDLDVYLAGIEGFSSNEDRLYLNGGIGDFTEVSSTHLEPRRKNSAVCFADIDGDGDQDLITDDLYLNDGTGHFALVRAFPLTSQAIPFADVMPGDIDGDGDLDVVALESGVMVFVNDGTGTFTNALSNVTTLPGRYIVAQDLELADFDGDLDLDILFGAAEHDSAGVLVNDGTGRFTQLPRPPEWPHATEGLATADVDLDGDLDLLIAGGPFNGEPSALILGDGRGGLLNGTVWSFPPRFRYWVTIPPPPLISEHMVFGDFDDDGDLDAVFGMIGRDELFLNNGQGLFEFVSGERGLPAHEDRTPAVGAGDFDGDGDLDLYMGNRTRPWNGHPGQDRLYVNDGTGVFTDETSPRLPLDNDRTEALLVVDVDADSDLDVVLGNYGQNRLYQNDGLGHFTDATAGKLPTGATLTTSMAVADVDGDGDPDFVCGNHGPATLYLNDGTGLFEDLSATRLPFATMNPALIPMGTSTVAFADVDGDSDQDLVIGVNYQQNLLFLNDGAGVFADVSTTHLPQRARETYSTSVGDFDEDGDLDIAFAGRPLEIWFNDGTGHFQVVPDPGWSGWMLAPPADVDGDGDLDLMTLPAGQGSRSWVLANQARQLAAPYHPRPGYPYDLEISAEPGYATRGRTAFPILGVGLAATPLHLPRLGTLYLDPGFLLVLPGVALPQATGTASAVLQVPSDSGLIGFAIAAQALIVDDGTARGRLTGYTFDTVVGF